MYSKTRILPIESSPDVPIFRLSVKITVMAVEKPLFEYISILKRPKVQIEEKKGLAKKEG